MTPRTNGTALKNFAVAKYRFHLTVTEQITLPPYKGSAFHGGFGHALKQLSPSFYDYFYPPPGRGDLPRPYVLIPPQRHASTTHPARPCNLDSPSSAPPSPTFPSASPPSKHWASSSASPAIAGATKSKKSNTSLHKEQELKDRRKESAAARTPANKLTEEERHEIIETCNQLQYKSLPPSQIVPRLADEGKDIASEASFYRVLIEVEQVNRRGRAEAPKLATKPNGHKAEAPKEVWSWHITYLASSLRGMFYYLYLL